MKLAIIVAHDPNLVIGYKGGLPWSFPEDIRHFRRRTLGHTVIMGRGVFEEIGEKELKDRTNLVVTGSDYPGIKTFNSIESALEYAEGEDKVYIIGGESIYMQTIDQVDRLEMTLIHRAYPGDAYFPEYRHQIGTVWEEVYREDYQGYSFVDYERIGS